MSSRGSSSSSGSEYARTAGNSHLRELGCYINLGGTAFEVPRIDVEQNRLWEREVMDESVDVIYPSGPSRANRLFVDLMTYKERSVGRTVSHFIYCFIFIYFNIPRRPSDTTPPSTWTTLATGLPWMWRGTGVFLQGVVKSWRRTPTPCAGPESVLAQLGMYVTEVAKLY